METGKQKTTKQQATRNDRILAVAILAAALVWSLFRFFLLDGEGASVRVTQDGEEVLVCSLKEDTVYTFTDKNGGRNTLCIQDGKAFMSAADCPDRLCMRQKAISRQGQSIICLPHRLVVEVPAGEEPEVDAVAG